MLMKIGISTWARMVGLSVLHLQGEVGNSMESLESLVDDNHEEST